MGKDGDEVRSEVEVGVEVWSEVELKVWVELWSEVEFQV